MDAPTLSPGLYGPRVERTALPEALRPFVLEVYEATAVPPPGVPLRVPVSATTTPTLNVVLSGTAVAALESRFVIPPVALGGPQPAAYEIEYHGVVSGFFVLFPAVGPLALLGVCRYWRGGPAAPPEYPGLIFPGLVRPALRAAALAYAHGLLAAPDFAARAALTEAFLLDALAGAPPADLAEAAFLQGAVDRIEAAGGAVRAGALARDLGVSPSTLRRRFAVLGMPVKRFAEVVRFRRAHSYLHATAGATLAETALRFGYADQAHFAREYRRLSGEPPTRWADGERMVDRRLGIDGPFREPERAP